MTNDLIKTLYQIDAIKFGNFTLKSGKTSSIYLDLRQMVSYPTLLRNAANLISNKICKLNPELICGVPYNALPITTCISLENNIPMIMCRKEKKLYGTKKQVEGVFKQNQDCLIIEDVITTGSSILEVADELEKVGLNINNVVVLIDREDEGQEILRKRNYHLHSAFTLTEILQYLFDQNILTPQDKKIVDTLLCRE